MSSKIANNSLPSGWCQATIGDLIAPFENSNPAHSTRDTFEYVDIDAIDNGEHRITNAKGLPTSKAPSRARKVIRTGDVLISLVRPYLKNIAIVPAELDEQWASTAFCVCRPHTDVDSRFFYYMFLQNDFLNALPTYGDSPPSGHDDDLLATTINLPPADEIVRITDRIDELLTDLSAGVAALERVKRNLSRYRAAVLHAAVTGRLTEAWRKEHGPADEPGPKLLERILAERRRQWEQRTLAKYEKNGRKPPKNWKSRYPEPLLAGNEPQGQLPPGWAWASVDQLAFVGSGTTPKRGDPRYWQNGDVPWVTSAVVNEEFVDEPSELVTATALEETSLRYYPPGTLLMALYGEGKTRGKVTELRIATTVNQALAALTWFDGSSDCKDFVKTALTEMYHQLRREAAGGVQPNLNAELVRKTGLPLPPLDEQAQIAEQAIEKLSQIDALEAEVERGLRRSGRMRQAILKAAFEGKLVPQDPSDEPASVLLERIREEAAAAESKPSRPKKKRPRKKKPSRKTTAK